jgi:hypothetical protein
MNSREAAKNVEVILGFVLGIGSMVLGSGFIADSCNLIFPTPTNSEGCQFSGSNLLALVGLVLVPMGAIALFASIAVLRRKQ